MSSTTSRQDVLAAKRAKLEELRRTRELKEKEKSSRLSLTPTRASLTPTRMGFSPLSSPSPLLVAKNIENVDNLVEKLMLASLEDSGTEKKKTVSVSTQVDFSFELLNNEKKIDIITYDKAIQTIESEILAERDLAESERSLKEQLTKELTASITEELQLENQIAQRKKLKQEANTEGTVIEVEEDKISTILSQSFKILNRSLNEDYNILTDYSKTEFQSELIKEEPIKQKYSLFIEEIHNRSINSIDWSPHHPELIVVAYTSQNKVSISSSYKPQYSYHPKYNAKGLVIIWNIKTPTIPEYVLTATTEILAIKFAKNNSFSVFGTGFNGKVMSWDLRDLDNTELSTPILQSPFSNNNKNLLTHSQPIYTLNQIHSNSATIKQDEMTNNGLLITASTDGLICSWSPYLLAQPNSTPISLKPPNEILSRYDELAPTQLITLKNDIAGFIVGCEDGIIYRVNRFDTPLMKVGIDSNNIWEGHSNGSITSLSPQNSNDNLYGDIFISSGLDWCIKLWKLNLSNTVGSRYTPPSTSDSFNESFGLNSNDYEKPLLTILRNNVIMDLHWRPNFKSQFVAVGSEGLLEFWDLSKDQLNPRYEILPSLISLKEFESIINDKKSLNKVSFNKNGDYVATGGLNGVLHIFKLDGDDELLKENNLDKFYSLIH